MTSLVLILDNEESLVTTGNGISHAWKILKLVVFVHMLSLPAYVPGVWAELKYENNSQSHSVF